MRAAAATMSLSSTFYRCRRQSGPRGRVEVRRWPPSVNLVTTAESRSCLAANIDTSDPLSLFIGQRNRVRNPVQTQYGWAVGEKGRGEGGGGAKPGTNSDDKSR